MPGSTTLFPATTNDEVANKSQHNMMGTRQPPPVAPRTTSITLQSWQQATSGGDGNFIDDRYARSASTDSLESSGSSSSGGGNANNRITDVATVEYIPTRTVVKTPKLPPNNPLQFVKVQSPLYKKAEQQIKLTKEVKITREALKEGEEEWQSNLDNWKSRRRKVSEKVIQRAEEMRQIEAEEQLRQEQQLQQQKKIKKFSEIVEKKSTRSYNLELYIGQGNDSGLGGTPEPDDTLDCQSSLLRSDTSEGMVSDVESVDSDIHKSDKVTEKEPPKVPQKPYSRFKKMSSISYDDDQTNSNELFQQCLSRNDLSASDNISSTEPSDVEGHAADTEATSSEEDATFSGQMGNTDSGLESLGDTRRGDLADSSSDLSQDSSNGSEKNPEKLNLDLTSDELEIEKQNGEKTVDIQVNDNQNQTLRLCTKHGDSKGFGFTLKGGKDQGCSAYIESVVKAGPADEMGLKDGDKIIALNGELTADYSHASLIFSIKQAVYTGILDIVINRSENFGNLNPEVKPRESRKGKSFAEKLAIFSAGITTPTSIEEIKSNAKSAETKRESLVLRRRSAFENGKTENANAVNRRSSCISHSGNTAEKVLEKRHSADFSLSQNVVNENNFMKKGPPPPVPVKPKIKSKPAYFDINKSLIKTNGTSENILSPSDSIINGVESHSPKSQTDNESLDLLGNSFFQESQKLNLEKQHDPTETNKVNLVDTFICEESSSHSEINETVNAIDSIDDQTYLTEELNITDECTNFEDVGENITDKILTSFEANEPVEPKQEFSNSGKTLLETTGEVSYSFFDRIEEDFIEDIHERTYENSHEQELADKINEETYLDTKICEETSMHVDEHSSAECAIQFSDDNIDNYLESDIVNEKEINSVSSACHSTCDNEDDLNASGIIECTDGSATEESESTEKKNNSQADASPLCLSLEKIDEDDVISASTTTSSDTPDTETVIETLPSNVSPLPNDESNGEDSSKILNGQDEESEQPLEDGAAKDLSSSETCDEKEIGLDDRDNYTDANSLIETSMDEPAQPYNDSVLGSVNNDVIDKIYYDEQDDEYAQELEESLDQITSLDIIDRIEQSLMDQLQKEDPFEDVAANLHSHLESDMENPWLYYPEESELLHDLTPRNLEPPREPPPPPPPPDEIENNGENNVRSISRTNSTKRIKKELWRRRSDFLGIESPEGIDVDNIPPPPPGLEELLKQEREQTQWLEKRLSLVEPEIDISSYSTESTCLDSGNYSTNDYSDYFLDDNEPPKETVIDAEHEQWKENVDEESLYETTFGIQYDSAPETLSTVIEESVKTTESPQHKAKQQIQNLGAAPKAKIMDSTKWITEKATTVNKKCVEPVFRQASYNQNYWLAQDGERRRNMQYSDSHVDRRYSMPPVYSNTQPDVTVRTWGDREYEYQHHRPRSAIYERSGSGENMYDQYMNMEKKDLQRTQSLDSHRDMDYETDTLESEVHQCSCCGKGLCEGSAMGIEALRLYFHIECFRCCLCHMQLGNGSCGTDVQVKNNQLYCPSCFTVD